MKLAICLLSIAATAHAGSRSSAAYSILTDSADAGGKRATSASYTNDGSVGAVAGLSTAALASEFMKSGYVGQLYDLTGLVVSAASSTVNETGTLQLSAAQLLDDTSTLAVNATSVTWGVVSGPITGISLAGLATAATVYQNTPATVQGTLGGFTGTLNLSVLDTIPDNFGSYAGDGVGDDWQVQYFGLDNPNAGPNVDFSRTGQTNLFKYVAGLDPTDPASVFSLTIEPVAGQPTRKNLVFSPVVAGRTYTVKARPDLGNGAWTTLTGTTQSNAGTTLTVNDLNATEFMKFYRVEITKP